MAVIKFTRALAIGERVEDIFRDFRTAQVPQTARRGAAVRVFVTADQASVFTEAFVGDRPVMERSEINDTTGRTPLGPIDPDDLLWGPEPARPLERLSQSLDNQSGAAANVYVVAKITEL